MNLFLFQIDLTEALESWAAKNVTTDDLIKARPVWSDASFTLKYYSDALFDFPHWFGFSKRKFKVSYSKWIMSSCCLFVSSRSNTCFFAYVFFHWSWDWHEPEAKEKEEGEVEYLVESAPSGKQDQQMNGCNAILSALRTLPPLRTAGTSPHQLFGSRCFFCSGCGYHRQGPERKCNDMHEHIRHHI